MATIHTLPVLGDNYVYLVEYAAGSAFAVDPGSARPVLHALEEHGLTLTTILATHHHEDHIGGVAELKRVTGCTVVSGDSDRIAGTDRSVRHRENLRLDDLSVHVLATPGHTRTSVCFEMTDAGPNPPALFSGDTLFVAGCGRLFECHARTMWQSLQTLAALPESTRVYCGHNYALMNYDFALQVEPDNQAIRDRLAQMHRLTRQGQPTVPSTIRIEKSTNLFLRAGSAEVFADLRRRKDIF